MVEVRELSRVGYHVHFDESEVARLKNLATILNVDVNQLVHNYITKGMAVTVCPAKREDDTDGLQGEHEGMGRSESNIPE